MNQRILVGFSAARMFRLLLASTLLILAGQTFNAGGQTVTILHSFGSAPSDGIGPQTALLQGSDGNFYGTTFQGGTTNFGTVFRISPSGTYTTLYSFFGFPSDGQGPSSAFVQANDGNFYGSTLRGGAFRAGTIFRISPSGAYTNLHSFLGAANGVPVGKFVQASDGNLYGTTVGYYQLGAGCFFRISPGGDYTNLYSFVPAGGPTNGCSPNGIILGTDGNFYGTTGLGGTNGCGTIFRISPGGTITNLRLFGISPQNGHNPWAGLVQGSDGNFYGTTAAGGSNELGAIFRTSPEGSYSNLYSFGSPYTDGALPEAGLVQGSDGNFYGTTSHGGTHYGGTVFRISPSGVYTSLYSFVGPPTDGETPEAGLVQGSDGNFYGTTTSGGTYSNGTVFRLTVPLDAAPFPINQTTGVQLSGTNVVFNVVSIAYETYQLQFSNSMDPTNWVDVDGISVSNSIGALLTVTNFGGAVGPQGFYRFAITP